MDKIWWNFGQIFFLKHITNNVNTFSISDTNSTSLAQIAMNCEKRGVGLREMMDDIIAKRIVLLTIVRFRMAISCEK